jgi:hypothetical protein
MVASAKRWHTPWGSGRCTPSTSCRACPRSASVCNWPGLPHRIFWNRGDRDLASCLLDQARLAPLPGTLAGPDGVKVIGFASIQGFGTDVHLYLRRPSWSRLNYQTSGPPSTAPGRKSVSLTSLSKESVISVIINAWTFETESWTEIRPERFRRRRRRGGCFTLRRGEIFNRGSRVGGDFSGYCFQCVLRVDQDETVDDQDEKACNSEQVEGEFGGIDSEAAQGGWRI